MFKSYSIAISVTQGNANYHANYHAEVAQADLHVFCAQKKIGEQCRQDRTMIQSTKAKSNNAFIS